MSGAPNPDIQVLSTLNADGSRRWLKPKVSPGRFLNRRRAVGYTLIAFFCTIPHLRIMGKPPILLDLMHREFTFFGVTLYPTDTLLFALLMLSVFLSVFFLTALFGRVWCGWGCPQTIYLEFVYRPIERFFEGAPGRKAKQGAWRKPAKLVTYLLVSFFLANTFIAYFVGTDNLFKWMTGSPFTHPVGFLVMAITTFLMMFDFAFFREQVCIVACPYGRFQSVMLDRNSLIITYDEKRGEPRGKKKRAAKAEGDVSLKVLPDEQAQGDCIDCKMCVTTCPTGIDIRDGLQLECVNCAQCIDACDAIMDKIGRPRGLIRYGSQAAVIDGKKSRILRPRTMIYPTIITGLLSAFTFVLLTRAPAYISILRQRGAPFALLEDGSVVNAVTVKVQNRRPEDTEYAFELVDVDGGVVEISGEAFVVEPQETLGRPMLLKAPGSSFPTGERDVTIRVTDEAGYTKDVKYRMIAPVYKPTQTKESSDG
ncbi:MAG: cytochrome c oxidase accessory protein CcoG [Phycisphaerales bacterium]|nr:cytochrome c oxidase accessory protein CcoG [Phycisphaerales bacterium]MCB9836877.1 cytochrome c oxidase accessory protein CcoG [Phycisphaera sp.]